MINFTRQLIAVPVRLLLWLTGLIPIFDRLKLAKLLWTLGGEVEDACTFIALTASSQGMEEARLVTEEIFGRINDARIGATIAWLEIQHGENFTAAQQWIDRTKEAPSDNEQMLLMVELAVSSYNHSEDTAEIVEQILTRNDLPMEFTRQAMLYKAHMLIKRNKFDEAQEITTRILSVENNPDAEKMAEFIAQNQG